MRNWWPLSLSQSAHAKKTNCYLVLLFLIDHMSMSNTNSNNSSHQRPWSMQPWPWPNIAQDLEVLERVLRPLSTCSSAGNLVDATQYQQIADATQQQLITTFIEEHSRHGRDGTDASLHERTVFTVLLVTHLRQNRLISQTVFYGVLNSFNASNSVGMSVPASASAATVPATGASARAFPAAFTPLPPRASPAGSGSVGSMRPPAGVSRTYNASRSQVAGSGAAMGPTAGVNRTNNYRPARGAAVAGQRPLGSISVASGDNAPPESDLSSSATSSAPPVSE